MFHGKVKKISNLHAPLHYTNRHLDEDNWDPRKQFLNMILLNLIIFSSLNKETMANYAK